MKINQFGEFNFIDSIKKNTIFRPEQVVVGIGDDGAVYKTTRGAEQIAVIDTMVEGIHFTRQTMTWWQVGYKVVASNLSDIAAMGGTPTHLVLSVAIPKNMEVEALHELYEGIKSICRHFGVNIIGGDTVASLQGLVITVSAFGELRQGRQAVTRSGAETGDIIAVTNSIGDAAAGLDALLTATAGFESLKRAHTTPIPMVLLGEILAQTGATSMNDISDGLASELNEIAYASHKELVVDWSHIPVSRELRIWCEKENKDIRSYVFYGGEDYQLVFTMKPKDFHELLKLQLPITKIGVVRSYTPVGVKVMDNKKENSLEAKGYNHFSEGER